MSELYRRKQDELLNNKEVDIIIVDSYHASLNSSYNISVVHKALTTSIVTVSDIAGASDEIRITANEDVIFNGSGFTVSNDSANAIVNCRWFDSSGNQLSRDYGADASVSAANASAGSADVKLADGDYITLKLANSAPFESAGLNFTVTQIVKTKINNL